VACAIEALGQQALERHAGSAARCRSDEVPLRAFDTVGLPALRALLGGGPAPAAPPAPVEPSQACPTAARLAPWPTNWPPPGTA
jgi:arsenite/tail-anchored protein-transporting ATPase